MDWNSNATMELLAQMPDSFTESNLEAIQAVIDKEKLLNSIAMGHDLCDQYAPFCAVCDKSLRFPCAVAYLSLKQAERILLEVAIATDEPKGTDVLPDFSLDGINVEEPEEGVYDDEPVEISNDIKMAPISEEHLAKILAKINNEERTNSADNENSGQIEVIEQNKVAEQIESHEQCEDQLESKYIHDGQEHAESFSAQAESAVACMQKVEMAEHTSQKKRIKIATLKRKKLKD